VTAAEREALVTAATSAFRARSRDGGLRSHPAFHDLDAAGRAEAFALTLAQRAAEAALDPAGLSTTARAVLARIGGR